MLHDTHVYLGPSLDLEHAKTLLPNAHYHVPVQCGDLLRLLRLDPKRIIIIDGYYEFTPAVWHKEILHVMDQGVEVWGAASMGALRAAELSLYGMKGIGQIFTDFVSGKLNDDDEVAVLHTSKQDGFKAINDAMINIRYTLQEAYQQEIISQAAHDNLLNFCKQQFYPHRSLSRAIKALQADFPNDVVKLSSWLALHGMIDLKKRDAMTVLKEAKQTAIGKKIKHTPPIPMTGYLKTLLNYAAATPLNLNSDWLPMLEKNFQAIANHEPIKHQVLAELSVFMRQFFTYIPKNISILNIELLEKYISENNLYSPEHDFAFLNNATELANFYPFILQLICETKITSNLIERYLPSITHYYDVPPELLDAVMHLLLKRLLVIIMLMKVRYIDLDAIVDNHYISSHLSRIATKRNYTQEKTQKWIDATHLDPYHFMSFLMMYLMSAGCVQSFNCMEKPNSMEYSKWAYSVINSL